jgi:hypothetical protein
MENIFVTLYKPSSKMHFSMQPVHCQYNSWCTGLAILLLLQFFGCNLGPGTIYTNLGFPFTYNCYYLLYMLAGLRVCLCISPQEPRNIFLEISHCPNLLNFLSLAVSVIPLVFTFKNSTFCPQSIYTFYLYLRKKN